MVQNDAVPNLGTVRQPESGAHAGWSFAPPRPRTGRRGFDRAVALVAGPKANNLRLDLCPRVWGLTLIRPNRVKHPRYYSMAKFPKISKIWGCEILNQ